jgi:hypothetical protein
VRSEGRAINMKAYAPWASILFVCAISAFSQTSVVVSSPAAGATVGIPFLLTAAAGPCTGQAIAAAGYSIDNGATTIVYATAINAWVTATAGSHTLHVKSWGNEGAACDTDVPIDVSASAQSNVTVSEPSNGAELVSPFRLTAAGTECDAQPIVAFGFSIDNSPMSAIVPGASVNAPVSAPLGAHTLHVKSWGNQGAGCMTDIAIDVMPSPVSQLPSWAIAVPMIQTFANWQAGADAGTGLGSDVTFGVTSLTASPSLSGTTREFVTTTANYGGERYDVQFGADTWPRNFLYDGWIYLTSSAANIENLELDMNQVMANGQTVIYGFQCDGWSGTWDYTANAGTPAAYIDEWLHSAQPCNIQNWTQNAWHHVQIEYARDDNGNVTYQSVWLDNVEQDLNVTVPSAFALNWGPTLLTNFQIDGGTAAQSTSTIYLDELTIYRW